MEGEQLPTPTQARIFVRQVLRGEGAVVMGVGGGVVVRKVVGRDKSQRRSLRQGYIPTSIGFADEDFFFPPVKPGSWILVLVGWLGPGCKWELRQMSVSPGHNILYMSSLPLRRDTRATPKCPKASPLPCGTRAVTRVVM